MSMHELVPAQTRWRRESVSQPTATALRCRRKFLRIFPDGFYDETYLEWERGYKLAAHERWMAQLGKSAFRRLLAQRRYHDIAREALAIESRTNLLFSFEKMAIRDAVKPLSAARDFATGLFSLLHGSGSTARRFDLWCGVVAGLPRVQTRVLTWPVATVFGFLGLPAVHFFVKPNVTRLAARAYGYELAYDSRPSWDAYANIVSFATTVRRDLRSLKPRDMIDIQSFLWVQGSDEYA